MRYVHPADKATLSMKNFYYVNEQKDPKNRSDWSDPNMHSTQICCHRVPNHDPKSKEMCSSSQSLSVEHCRTGISCHPTGQKRICRGLLPHSPSFLISKQDTSHSCCYNTAKVHNTPRLPSGKLLPHPRRETMHAHKSNHRRAVGQMERPSPAMDVVLVLRFSS